MASGFAAFAKPGDGIFKGHVGHACTYMDHYRLMTHAQ